MNKFHTLLRPVFVAAVILTLQAGNAVAQQAVPDTIAQRTLACAACHGKQGVATSEGYFPRIAGKPAGYLYNQLVNFREGRRTYAQMTYMVDHLSDPYLKEIADYFAGLQLPYPAPETVNVDAAQMERGKQLVLTGDPVKHIPACASCHGQALTGVTPSIPGLLGLPRDYLNGELGAWRSKSRRAMAPDCMAELVARLDSQDIPAVTAWLASQPVPLASAPVSALPERLPLTCGSVAK